MNEIKGEYVGRNFPALSKSKIKTYKFCTYCFLKELIFREEFISTMKSDIGTNTHLVFDKFFEEVDLDFVYKNVNLDVTIPESENELPEYFYSVCMDILVAAGHKEDTELAVYQRIYWKFALLESRHFYYLNSVFNTKKEIKKFFYPSCEERIFIESIGLYGTIDRNMYSVNQDGSFIEYVADYKTGNVPKSVRDGLKDKADPTSWVLPTRYMFELHFYMLLHLLNNGWDLSDKLKRFLNNNEWYNKKTGEYEEFVLGKTEEEQELVDDQITKYLTSLGKEYKPMRFNNESNKFEYFPSGGILAGIIYLSGNPDIEDPLPTKKKFNYRSYKTVLRYINEVRMVWKYYHREDADDYFLIRKLKKRPEYNIYKCPKCSRNKQCLDEHEQEMIEAVQNVSFS